MKNDKETMEAIVLQLNALTETCQRIEERCSRLETHLIGRRIEPLVNPPAELLDMKLSESEDYVSRAKLLANENIHTIGDLIQCTAIDLLRIRNFGSVSLTNIRNTLRKHGLTLKGEPFD